MSPTVNILETVTLVAPLALQFFDSATSGPVKSGLQVLATPLDAPSQVTAGVQGWTTGIFSFAHLPGLRAFENGPGVSRPRSFSITVSDTEGRFLPAQFTMPLPVTGLGLPAFLPVSSPPGTIAQGIPLFNAPSRVPPVGMAVLRADVWDASSNRPAAWALVEAAVGGAHYKGLADGAGKLTMIFPYPEPPAWTGVLTSPPRIAPGDQTWSLQLQAFYQPARSIPVVPDLCEALDQPPAPLWSDTSLSGALAPLTLSFGRELIARSRDASTGGPLSTLLLTPVASPLDHL